jgi:SAM-dependent methyltransferase
MPRKYAGVLSILRYNWHFYAVSLCVLASIALLLRFVLLPSALQALLVAAAIPTAIWSLSSLLVSWYVYDLRGVTRWDWLPEALSFGPRRWLNIHAGLDESTPTLRRHFPGAQGIVVDIYDPSEMTEPSIARARLLHPPTEPPVAARIETLPFPDQVCDTLFLLFAAHEIRLPYRRTQFFLECARVLAGSGQLMLVEHLRDWRNFAAFGPGFLHFHGRGEWLRLAHAAGLSIVRETPLTPFVRCFLMTKSTSSPT